MLDWNQLDIGWKTAFNNAWDAFRNNTIPIGSIIKNEDNEIVGIGKNMVYSKESEGMTIYGNKLAHAEINAILQVSDESKHPNIRKYTLYTTLEPCPLCFGAIVMGNIRRIKYAARDKFAGATILNNQHEYIKSKRLEIEGPIFQLEILQIILLSYSELKLRPENCERLLMEWYKDCRKGVEIGRELFKSKQLTHFIKRSKSFEEVFNYLSEKYFMDKK